MGVRRATLKSDSQVIIGQVDKSRNTKSPTLEKYLDMVRRMESSFEVFSVKNIPRLNNEHADMLAKFIAKGSLSTEVFFEILKAPLVELMEKAILTVSSTHSENSRT
jgi:ribonuclease HI